jgi:ABC-type sugar transport system ATPase subunit
VIRVTDLCIVQGEFALKDVSFEIPEGEYGVLMGKTGSGKTTILECICGLRPMQSGTVELSGSDVTRLKPGERGIGYVPQDGSLFVTMTVREQLSLAMTIRHWPMQRIDERVNELAEMLGIHGLLDRYPHGLSGGEIQRVALGRALSSGPSILCLDEPLSALDDETHSEICDLLDSVKQQTGVTILHITHRKREMRRLADKLLKIEDGIVEEEDLNDSAQDASPA